MVQEMEPGEVALRDFDFKRTRANLNALAIDDLPYPWGDKEIFEWPGGYWDPKDGTWRVVVMNVDATRGVTSDMSVGAELDSVLWIGLGLLGIGALLAAGTALAITGAVRRR